jgi:hypothetical protein
MFSHRLSTTPIKTINLWEWLLLENKYTPYINDIRTSSNEEERKFLKSKLPAITPSGVFSKRKADCLVEPTNLICIDIDGKDNPSISDMEELKKKLSKLSYIMYCGLSASGKGLFCIIPYKDYRNHKLHFNALEQEFKDMGIVVDSSCSDIGRLRFYSYDEYPYANPDAEIYTRTLEKVPEIKQSRFHQKTDIVHNSNQTLQNIDKNTMSLEEFFLSPTNMDYASATPLSKTQKVERLLKRVIEEKKDITLIQKDWIAICCIIKNLFGDEGRELFHQVSSFYPKYDYDEADDEYSKDRSKYLYNTDRLFEIAAKYGF